MNSGALQAKPAIGQPGDKYEREADRVAEAVMRMPTPLAAFGGAIGIEESWSDPRDATERRCHQAVIAHLSFLASYTGRASMPTVQRGVLESLRWGARLYYFGSAEGHEYPNL
jgi:hypothetical protein